MRFLIPQVQMSISYVVEPEPHPLEKLTMARSRTPLFDPQLFLTKVGKGKTSLLPLKKRTLFSQGEAAETVFYIQSGKVKLTVVSQQGKENSLTG